MRDNEQQVGKAAELLSVEEVGRIDALRPNEDDFTSEDWQWAISLCGGRDRLYGPDTPGPVASYVAVVPRQRAERAEQEVEYLLRWFGGFDSELDGLSADALTEVAFRGGEPRNYPRDTSDLGRCERAFAAMPAHLQDRVRPILERWRFDLATQQKDQA